MVDGYVNQQAAPGPYGCQPCKPVVVRGAGIPHGRNRGLLDKVNLRVNINLEVK
jgi:hypothetical protein